MKSHRHVVPEVAVSLALDRHDPHRELTSQLISDLHGRVLSKEELARAFDALLGNLSDLILDTPNAPVVCFFVPCFRSLIVVNSYATVVFVGFRPLSSLCILWMV